MRCALGWIKADAASARCEECPLAAHVSDATFRLCVCGPGLAGDLCQDVVRSMTLQMSEAQFLEKKTQFDTALASSYGVNLADVTTSVVAPNPARRLLNSNNVVIDATIRMGTRQVPSDEAIMSSMSQQNFPVVLVSLTPGTTPAPAKDKDNSFLGRIVSELPFGDDVPLVMTLFVLLVLCVIAMCVCVAKLAGPSACCGCAAKNRADDYEEGLHTPTHQSGVLPVGPHNLAHHTTPGNHHVAGVAGCVYHTCPSYHNQWR